MAEIDDDRLAKLTAAERLLDKMLSPKTKRRAEALIKEHFPDTVVSADNDPPELGETRAAVDKLSKKFDDHLDSLRQRADDEATDQAWGRLRSEGYTEEGVDWIKKTMVERKIGDPEAAAALYDKMHPPEPQRPAGFMPQGWGIGHNPDKNPDLDRLLNDTDNWADEEAAKVLREAASSTR